MTKYLIHIALLVWCSSCIKDNSDCGDGCAVTLTFSYTFNAEEKELFNEEINDVYLYLFDERGNLYNSTVLNQDHISTRTISLELEPANYTAVAWGNLAGDSYRVTGEPSRSSLGVELVSQNGEAHDTAIDLFHSIASFEAIKNHDNRASLSFIKNTNTINVLLQSNGTRTLPGTDVSIRITATNGTLDFENNKAATGPTTYLPDYDKTEYDGRTCDRARFRVMKLEKGDDTTIQLYRDGVLNKEESLTGLILGHFPHITTNEDFDRYSDYTFVYEYDDKTGNYVLASISVESWTENVKRPGGI